MKLVLILMACLFLSTPVFADRTEDLIIDKAMLDVLVHNKESVDLLTPYQVKVYAYQIGAKEDLGETLRAITFLESHFGKNGRIGDGGVARGITQIQRPTAKYILNKLMGFNINFSDYQVDLLLTKNDKLSIILSKRYLVYLMAKFSGEDSWDHGLLSYNVGISRTLKYGTSFDPNGYLPKAKKFIKEQRGT